MKANYDVIQGSVQWLELRAGIPTASEFGALITEKGNIKKGEGVRTYLATKLAEAWTGGPLPSGSSKFMDNGKLREDRAIPWYETEYGVTVLRPGFVTTDDGKVGCSPDGLFEDGSGIEVKCPAPHTHVGYLLDQELPGDYFAQVHGSMLVTGAKRWQFLSYCPRFPTFVLTVNRDPTVIDTLQRALDAILVEIEAGLLLLEELHGGPRPKREPFVPSSPDDPRKHLFEGLPGEFDSYPVPS